MNKKINWKIVAFLAVIAVAIFFRAYKFDDWLLFKGDSFRDALLVSHSFDNGVRDLPLLGPKAGGTKLRLGPIFYYFQYLSTIIFQSKEAPVFAYPVLFFSLLTIPLVYFFLRKYFNQNWALILTGMFSLSFLAVEYSRFAWNPNMIPFFNILFFFSLLEIFSEKNKPCTHDAILMSTNTDDIKHGINYAAATSVNSWVRDKINKNWWFLIAGISFSVASQLHYASFLGLPIIAFLMLIINRKKLKEFITLKRVVIFGGAVIFFYVPVIVNEILTQGDNSKQFWLSIFSKSEYHSVFSNLFVDAKFFSKNFLRILFGYLGSSKILYLISGIFISIAVWLNTYLFKREKDYDRRNFLILSLTIFISYFSLYIPLAFTIDRPRFFLPIIIIPYIFFGYLASGARKKITKILAITAVMLITGINLYFLTSWLDEMKRSQTTSIDPEKSIILQEKGSMAWWTWAHFKKSAQYISQNCQGKSIYYIVEKGMTDYQKSIEYAFESNKETRPLHKLNHSVPYNLNGCYYYIATPQTSFPDVIRSFKKEKPADLGNISITRFNFTAENMNEMQEDQTGIENERDDEEGGMEKSPERKSSHDRRYWSDIFYFVNKFLSK
jgi:4-amino-4-deoxy-L-arabinose transferase-like glycosyltransferase